MAAARLYIANVRSPASLFGVLIRLIIPSREYMCYYYPVAMEHIWRAYLKRWGIWAANGVRWHLNKWHN